MTGARFSEPLSEKLLDIHGGHHNPGVLLKRTTVSARGDFFRDCHFEIFTRLQMCNLKWLTCARSAFMKALISILPCESCRREFLWFYGALCQKSCLFCCIQKKECRNQSQLWEINNMIMPCIMEAQLTEKLFQFFWLFICANNLEIKLRLYWGSTLTLILSAT